ncbi:MAG: dihydropteroate synthase [Clostridiaceae bacterium]|jgi:5-methyltetrahydrofolate--homocysteine methyltransferase|nr:homocysteine S-methyltransferase family protein [Bacillota bacterium]NLI38239.1 dihydropteroate synthase [Clostridiaceae bacterium]
MTRQEFKDYFNKGIVILDGATGTQLYKSGMPVEACPEKWAAENPEALISVQKRYVESGSDILYTFTMGGNAIKLSEYGLKPQTRELNKRLAEITKNAAAGKALVAGDISSCGILLEPYGEIGFEESVESYKEQVKGLFEGGVDLFVIETMLDIQETRAALIAIRELCDLPAMVTMTFEDGMRTLMGTDPVSALVTLQSLGADAVGCNCSSGPAEMVDILKAMKPYAKVPLIAKPNAGKPRLVDGNTVFNMDSDAFCSYAEALIGAGANALGGCCGTTPEYIKKLSETAGSFPAQKPVNTTFAMVSSNRQTLVIHRDKPLTIIGERLNPTGKKFLREALTQNNMDKVAQLAREQMEAGAGLLDVNAGVPGLDEKTVLVNMVQAVLDSVPLPLCLDSSSPEALEAALRIYPGRAVINSISGEEVKMEKILPLAAKYGAMFILLPIDDKGVPVTAEERIGVIKRVYDTAKSYGFSKEDILVDGVVMTVATGGQAAGETLKVLSWCTDNGFNTVVGLSNVSFGLPARENINAAFLAMAVAYGLSSAILNPNSQQLMDIKRASDVLKARDSNASEYIRYYSSQKSVGGQASQPAKKVKPTAFEAVLNGMGDEIADVVQADLDKGLSPKAIIDNSLIPAIQKVGELYEDKKYFLPQLIKGAEAMQKAMEELGPYLQKETEAGIEKKGTIVMATVKGDIHDIGKNIVVLLLRNYGFEVIDLGKDVPADRIIQAAKDNNADIIGLSALMTTTMTEMPKIARMAADAGLKVRIMVGGAVLDNEYARSFGAHYSKDAYSAVRLAESLLKS